MSIDAGGLAQMTLNTNNAFSNDLLGTPSLGYGARSGSRFNSKRLSVALPPKVSSISEHQVDNPTPRTSRSHLLAGLRTQPRTQAAPASAPYNQSTHQGFGNSQRAGHRYKGYDEGVPQTAIGAGFDPNGQYGMNAGQQIYSLPEQVLAPPSLYDQAEEMDPAVLQQMQMTSLYLAQRQQQLQQQLASLTASAGGLSLNANMQRNPFQHGLATPHTQQSVLTQPMQSPIELPGQPGVYLVYNPALGGYSYAVNQQFQEQAVSPVQQNQYCPSVYGHEPANPKVSVTPPAERPPSSNTGSFTPPKNTPTPPSNLDHVEPLPPPSSNAFRRGHSLKNSVSLSINPCNDVFDGPKTTSAATFGSQRGDVPPGPMSGTFGPGAARAGEHPVRQPRGPPPLEELTGLPTNKHEGSKNFAARQRRRALNNLVKAGSNRRAISRSPGGSPASECEYNFAVDEGEDDVSIASSRKMSPIGSEMKEKRDSQGSDGYFGLCSASSSEGEEGPYKQPPTPATPISDGAVRKKMMLGVLNATEKRRSIVS